MRHSVAGFILVWFMPLIMLMACVVWIKVVFVLLVVAVISAGLASVIRRHSNDDERTKKKDTMKGGHSSCWAAQQRLPYSFD